MNLQTAPEYAAQLASKMTTRIATSQIWIFFTRSKNKKFKKTKKGSLEIWK